MAVKKAVYLMVTDDLCNAALAEDFLSHLYKLRFARRTASGFLIKSPVD